MMISVSFSKTDWMDIANTLDCVSLAVLKSDNIEPAVVERYSKLYHISSTIRLEVLKSCEAYPLLYNELKDIHLVDILNKSDV